MQNFLRNLFARYSQHEESQTVNADFLYDGTDGLDVEEEYRYRPELCPFWILE